MKVRKQMEENVKTSLEIKSHKVPREQAFEIVKSEAVAEALKQGGRQTRGQSDLNPN